MLEHKILIEVQLRSINVIGIDISLIVLGHAKIIHAEDIAGIRAAAAPFIAVVDLDHGVIQGIAIKVHQAAKRHVKPPTIRDGQAIQHRTERLVGIYYAAGLFFPGGRFVEPISPEVDMIHYEEATVSVHAEILAHMGAYRRRKADNDCRPNRIKPVGAPVLTFAGAYTITDTPKHIDPARQRRTGKE